MTKGLYKIDGMDCDACAKMVELDLEDAGIKASCNFVAKTLQVETENKDQAKKAEELVERGGYKLTPL